MTINFGPERSGLVEINNARLAYKNFSGAQRQYNRQGDRNFAVIIPDEESADALSQFGFNVRIKPPRNDDESPFMFLRVKVNFSRGEPRIYIEQYSDVYHDDAGIHLGECLNKQPIMLDEETIYVLDDLNMIDCDLDLRMHRWKDPTTGKASNTAYLRNMRVRQKVDRFAAEYEGDSLGLH